jgi:hypothetical protein
MCVIYSNVYDNQPQGLFLFLLTSPVENPAVQTQIELFELAWRLYKKSEEGHKAKMMKLPF